MIKNFKIDYVFTFLLLSLLGVVFFVGDFSFFIKPLNANFGVKTYVSHETVYDITEGKTADGNMYIQINKFNDNFDLFYSVNGGKTYQSYSGQNLLDLKYPDLSKFNNSMRDKKPFGKLPKIVSVLIKAKHKHKSIYVRPKAYNFTKTFNSELPIVALIANQDDLFDDLTGIMTLGQNSWFDDGFYKESWYRNANYNQRGHGWHKSVYFQYIDQNNNKYNNNCLMQISGHASRSFPQKSIKLRADQEKFAFSFFGTESLKKYSSLVLRISGNDNTKTLFADLLMHNLIANTNVLSQKGQPVNVFINTNYWGIYNLRERHNSYYIAKKEDVKTDEVTVLERSKAELKKGNPAEQQNYINFIDSLEVISKKGGDVMSYADGFISLKSFIDYMIIETYYGNSDWLFNNTLWYKAKNKKWKWIIVDLDNALAYKTTENVNKNYFDFVSNSGTITARLFNILIADSGFKSRFVERGKKLLNSNFSPENVRKEYKKLKEQIATSINHHLKRWRHTLTTEKWEVNCENNLTFLLERNSIYLNQLNKL